MNLQHKMQKRIYALEQARQATIDTDTIEQIDERLLYLRNHYDRLFDATNCYGACDKPTIKRVLREGLPSIV